jgi:hypothetical protein
MKDYIMINESSALEIFKLIHKGESDYAYAYGLNIDEDNTEPITHLEINKSRDIYDVLEKISQDSSGLIWDAIAVTTQGWAAPLGSSEDLDTPPSQHPDRTRVFLVCIITNERDIHSVIKIEGKEPVYDNSGTGALADALLNVYPKVKLKNENNNQFYV